jgi:hypothetical protein
MKSVSIRVRQTTSRVPFRGGTYRAQLERDDSADFAVLGTTRGHETWAAAAAAALRLADQRGYIVTHRPLVEKRIRKEGGL